MTGQLFLMSLRRHWRTALYWGLGLGILGLYTLSIAQDADLLKQYAQLVNTMPPAMTAMFGITDVGIMATPEGVLNLSFFSFLPLFIALFAVPAGMNVSINEEEEGIMDILMALPIPRWRVVAERLAAYGLLTLLIVVLVFLGLMLSSVINSVQVNHSIVLQASLNIFPITFFMIAMTACLATLVRQRSRVMSIAGAFIIAGYFWDTLGNAASTSIFASLRGLSYFSYFASGDVFKNGFNVGNAAVLIGVSIILVAISLWGWQRRDIGL